LKEVDDARMEACLEKLVLLVIGFLYWLLTHVVQRGE
jgi:hypothetical protein